MRICIFWFKYYWRRSNWQKDIIGSGDGLLQEAFPETMLAKIYNAIWHH